MGSTFDTSKGNLARDDAMTAVGDAASEAWKLAVWEAILFVTRTRTHFTTDAIWHRLESKGAPTLREPRAMGPMMRRAVHSRLCILTDRVKRSIRAECHRRPVAIYESLRAEAGALLLSEDTSLFAPMKPTATFVTDDCAEGEHARCASFVCGCICHV